MKVLVLDNNTATQAFCAKRFEAFSKADTEMLDLKVKLVGEKEFAERVSEADVLIVGSGMGNQAVSMCRQARAQSPWIHIIMFVTEEAYGGGAFRAAHAVGVRKVFPDSSSPLDLLQELVAILSEFRREGRTREGRVVAVTHAKGGVGATTIAAALAEVCSVFNRKTLLWDLDVETRDLSRSLTVSGPEAKIVSSWVNGSREISRESLEEAVIPISSDVAVLVPPDRMAESMDLVCHTDGIHIVERIIETSRILYDVIIVDAAGKMGPAAGTLLRNADVALIVVDDSVLGLTAVDLFLTFVKTLVGGADRITFLVNPSAGNILSVPQIAAELEPVHRLGEHPWRLPPLIHDSKASLWPGSGRTLYSMGQKSTRSILERVAAELGLIDPAGKMPTTPSGMVNLRGADMVQAAAAEGGSWISKMLKKGK